MRASLAAGLFAAAMTHAHTAALEPNMNGEYKISNPRPSAAAKGTVRQCFSRLCLRGACS